MRKVEAKIIGLSVACVFVHVGVQEKDRRKIQSHHVTVRKAVCVNTAVTGTV